MFSQIDPLLQRISALEKEVQKLKDDQIKQNRDYKDAMYNLDTDNIPALQGVVKKVNLIISEDGTVKAEFVMEVINNESNAKIKADRINLEGLVLNLTANNITISSENFNVDENGNMKCNNAEMGNAKIKRSCVLASDIDVGQGMQIGPVSADEQGTSRADLYVINKENGYGGYSRGVNITTVQTRAKHIATDPADVKIITGESYIAPWKAGASMHASTVEDNGRGYEKGFVGLERSDTSTVSNDFITAIMRVGDHALWIDKNGNLCTTATELKTGQQI